MSDRFTERLNASFEKYLNENQFSGILRVLSNCGTVDARVPLSEAVYEAYYGTEK